MAKRKEEPEPEKPEFVFDDDGVERKVNHTYLDEKFTYRGTENVFLLVWTNGHILPVSTERDQRTVIREIFFGE